AGCAGCVAGTSVRGGRVGTAVPTFGGGRVGSAGIQRSGWRTQHAAPLRGTRRGLLLAGLDGEGGDAVARERVERGAVRGNGHAAQVDEVGVAVLAQEGA